MRALQRRPEDRFEHVRELGVALWPHAGRRTRHVWAKRFSSLEASVAASGVRSTGRLRIEASPRLFTAAGAFVLAAAAMALFSWYRAQARRETVVDAATLALRNAPAPPLLSSPPAQRDVVTRPPVQAADSVAVVAAQPVPAREAAPQSPPTAPEPEEAPAFALLDPEPRHVAARAPAARRPQGTPRVPARGAVRPRPVARSAASEPVLVVPLPPDPSESEREPDAPLGANQSPILD